MQTTSWNIAPSEVILPFSEVHVWSVSVAEAGSLHESHDVLSKEEVKRAETFRDTQAQMQFVTGRFALRQILSHYLGITPQKIGFSRGARGKLALAAPLQNEIQFNLSHSRGLVLLAFTRQRDVGIDLEKIEDIPDAIDIAERFFSVEEAACVRAAQDPKEIFYKYWTRKEALLKCSGRGIDDSALGTSESFEGVICELQPALGYASALAVSGSQFGLKTWRWLLPQKSHGSSMARSDDLLRNMSHVSV